VIPFLAFGGWNPTQSLLVFPAVSRRSLWCGFRIFRDMSGGLVMMGRFSDRANWVVRRQTVVPSAQGEKTEAVLGSSC